MMRWYTDALTGDRHFLLLRVSRLRWGVHIALRGDLAWYFDRGRQRDILNRQVEHITQLQLGPLFVSVMIARKR